MTDTTSLRSRSYLRFAGHYVEMVVAMFVGMFVLAPVWSFAAPGLVARDDVGALVMAFDMTVGMVLWMRVRRHAWRPIVEMSVAMVAPFVVLLVPYWLGAVSGETLMMAGHTLMFATMLLAMLLRPAEYLHHRH
ncbi:hypothetical protein [Virgisporangium aliadipatigenens]|nr:hypothetical protein [Virgisporangium aliadipatigenens]